jgi:hypothetical protein
MTTAEREQKLAELKQLLSKVSKIANAITVRTENFSKRMRDLRFNIEDARFCLYQLEK